MSGTGDGDGDRIAVLYSVRNAVVVVVHCEERKNRPRAESVRASRTRNWCGDLGIGVGVFSCCGMSMDGMMSAVAGLDGWVG
jgi:hypothetical protein